MEEIWKDFWSFLNCSSSNENDHSEEDDEEEGSLRTSPTTKMNNQGKLKRKLNDMLAANNAHVYTDTDDKKLQIVEEDDYSSDRTEFGKMKANNSENATKKSNLKIGGKFALKFRALVEFECVQCFIQEADFVFYQYIVDYLIPKVSIS